MGRYAIELLSDNEKLAQFKQKAAAHARLFDIDKIVPQYEELYNRFL
jgi:glycogen synthase